MSAPDRIWVDEYGGRAVSIYGTTEYIRADLVPQWMPIETAPKDGTKFYAIDKYGNLSLVQWYDNPFGKQNTVINNWTGKWWTVDYWMPNITPPPAS